MAVSEKDLLEIEKGFWTFGEAHFRANTDKECLVAFPAMAGVMSNADIASTATNPHRWRDVTMDVKGVVEPGSDVAILTYEAHAARENGEPYAALVSTGY